MSAYVYWHLGPDDEVLYIGCTIHPAERHGIHRKRAVWWPLVERIVLDGPFEDLLAAQRYEQQLIVQTDPPYNMRWTSRDRRPINHLLRPEHSAPLVRPRLSTFVNAQPMVMDPEVSSSTFWTRLSRAS